MRADLALEERQAVTWELDGESVSREPTSTERLNNGVRFAKGLLIASALSTPIWLAVVLFVV